jgi:hypothetical protein
MVTKSLTTAAQISYHKTPPNSTFSSSVLQLWQNLGFLNNVLSFKVILDLFCPFCKFRLFKVISDFVFLSGLGTSYWSTCKLFPFVYFLYNTSFRHSIYVSKPTQSLRFSTIYYVPAKQHQHGINQSTQQWFANENNGKYDKWQQCRWNTDSRSPASSISFQLMKNLHTLGINSVIISTLKGRKYFLYVPR